MQTCVAFFPLQDYNISRILSLVLLYYEVLKIHRRF